MVRSISSRTHDGISCLEKSQLATDLRRASFSLGIHTRKVVTARVLVQIQTAFDVWTNLCFLGQVFLGCGFFACSFRLLFIVLIARKIRMPGHFMDKAAFIFAGCTGHDRLVVAPFVYLARVAVRSQTRHEVGNLLKCCERGFSFIS
jgi:hypothetical protein